MIDTKEYQIWFREHIDEFPEYWDREHLGHFSPNFFREFRDRFHWHSDNPYILTPATKFIWTRFGNKFVEEITGYKNLGDC